MPAPIVTLLRGCLQKERRNRIADIAAATFVLDHAAQLAPVVEPMQVPAAAQPPMPSRPVWRRAAPAVAALAVGTLVAGGTVWLLTQPAPPSIVRTTLTTSGSTALALLGADRDIAITPDGSRVVYRGNNQLLVRALDQLEPTVLTGLGVPRGVFIAPDGQWIGFFDGSLLKKVAITGGLAVTIARPDGGAPRGATWGPDGSIIFATTASTTGLQRVSAAGGEATVLTKPDRERGEADHFWPEFLPSGQAIFYTIIPTMGGVENAQIAVLDLRTGTSKVLVRGGSHAHYGPTGHLVYAVAGTLRAVAFDLERLEAAGTATPVLEGVFTTPQGTADVAVAANGSLALCGRYCR